MVSTAETIFPSSASNACEAADEILAAWRRAASARLSASRVLSASALGIVIVLAPIGMARALEEAALSVAAPVAAARLAFETKIRPTHDILGVSCCSLCDMNSSRTTWFFAPT